MTLKLYRALRHSVPREGSERDECGLVGGREVQGRENETAPDRDGVKQRGQSDLLCGDGYGNQHRGTALHRNGRNKLFK